MAEPFSVTKPALTGFKNSKVYPGPYSLQFCWSVENCRLDDNIAGAVLDTNYLL